ncbi:hypothetical protein E4T81_03840 [Barnesiella sp. WM24]|uniref:hypothetical protein n=1 Tax=Barnesiella sp. WM24 TaxID=2558278 RepID=UPI0010718653|nr:hypothetical protein [Barnesiella sp. WM24]TFU94382.1 hypothetical protein E4T81_03840 [Barnesiella sp. WM24]
MSDQTRYRVLWIEDDPNFKDSFERLAKLNGIYMSHYADWESASIYLNQYLDEIDAVIFDAHCKIKKAETVGNDSFLHIAIVDLLLIFAKHHTVRPWYILSAGTMNRFADVTAIIEAYRKDYVEEWGELVYTKTRPNVFSSQFSDEFGNGESEPSEMDLISTIKVVCSNHSHNHALARHRDALQYLGVHSLIRGNARKFLLQLLDALYDPKGSVGFAFTGNPIRRIFECIVRAGVERGIIPEEAIAGGNVKCMEASRFLCGENPKELPYRYGLLGERILDATESSMLITILTSTNVASHESAEDYEEDEVTLTEDNRDEFSGCALLMCRVIKAFGRYAESHKDIEENKLKWKPNPNTVEGKEMTIQSAGSILYAGDCLLPVKSWLHPGNKVILKDVVLNTDVSAGPFPFFCKNPQTPKAKR